MTGSDPRVVQLLMALRRQGISDARVLGAVEKTPREMFVEPAFLDRAYEDAALPIECGQTISQPLIVALMTQALDVTDRCKVLEVGTGSGYQAAVLSHLARRVYTIERYRTLLAQAEKRFAALRLMNITSMVGDGAKGWPAQAPFDRIIVSAAARARPDALLEQLRDGGVLVAPVGPEHGPQRLIKYEKRGEEVIETELAPVRFVPLVEGAPVTRE